MVIIPKVDAKVTLLFVLEKSCSKYRKIYLFYKEEFYR